MTTTSAKAPQPLRARIKRQTAIVSRWLHIYLSMVSFAIVLFFAVTGLTLNHPDWFAGQSRTVVRHGLCAPAVLTDKLALVEMLRAREHVHGAVTDYRVEDGQVTVSFKAPGYTADAFVDRATGKYDVTEVASGPVAVLNDLHRGQASGKAWGWVIDLSAVLLALVSLTGIVLMWFVYKKRVSGFLLAGVGLVVVVGIWKWLVP